MKAVCVIVGLALLATVSGCATAPEAVGVAAEHPIQRFFAAESESDEAAAIEALVASGIPAQEVAEMLRAGRSYDAEVPRGWIVHVMTCVDGVARPFHVFVPESYTADCPHPVLFDLHGAVVGPGYTVEELAPRRGLWQPVAAEQGMLLVMPHGDRAASWWSRTGHDNLLAQLAFLKRNYNVDENRVFLSGFSDGGSGALWMAFHDPTPWAGFISFMGTPVVAGLGPYPCYPRNLLSRPIRAVNGVYDTLYPASGIKPLVDQLLGLGVSLQWTVYAIGHDLGFFPTERTFSEAFLRSIARRPLRSEVLWETADAAVGRCDWVRVDEIGDVGNNAAFADVNMWFSGSGADFGVGIGPTVNEGLTVAGVVPGSLAHSAELRSGDVIGRVDGKEIRTTHDLRDVMQAVETGRAVTIEVVRDGEQLVLTGRVPGPDAVYVHPLLTASIHARAVGNVIDVDVRHVVRYTLLLSSMMLDFEEPLVVVTNGEETYRGPITPDVRFLLEQAAADQDRRAVYEARIEIQVPPK